MGTSVNISQVENIIQSLNNTVNIEHVGAINSEGAVTQVTNSWCQRVCHFFKTLLGSPAVVEENRAILKSYKAMLHNNLGEVYGKAFSDRLRKVEASGFYTKGKDLSRQLRSIVNQYKADRVDKEKMGAAEKRALTLIESAQFQTAFKGRLEWNLKARGIPETYAGALEMEVDASRLFCKDASDFILRNDRCPNDDEIQKMLERPLRSAFKDVNKKNCDNLCSTYPFITSDSKDSMDVMLHSALVENGINVDVPKQYLDTLVNEVKNKLCSYSTFVTLQNVKDTISSVIKNAARHEFIDPAMDKILTQKIIARNIPSSMSGLFIDLTQSLTSFIQAIAKDAITTKDLEVMLRSCCSTFRQECSALPQVSMLNTQQQDEHFLEALECAMEFCLLDSVKTVQTQTMLLNRSNDVVGARSPFVNIMYALSNDIATFTDPDTCLMLKSARTMVSILDAGIAKASAESEPAEVELRNSLEAKRTELDKMLQASKQIMDTSPLTVEEHKKNPVQEKYKDEIKKYEGVVQNIIRGIHASERPQEDFDKYVIGLQEAIRDLRRLGNFHEVQRELKVEALQSGVTSLRNAIEVFESKMDALILEKTDDSGQLLATQSALSLMHEELLGKLDELAVAKADLAQQEMAAFRKYVNAFTAEESGLNMQVLRLQEDIDITLGSLEVMQARVKLLSVNANDDEDLMFELEATIAMLQASQTSIDAKTTELTELVPQLRTHTETQRTAHDLLASMNALQLEIAHLQNKMNALPMSKTEREANSSVVKYLSTGKDFGGLVSYNTYQRVHANRQVPNNVGLTVQEKSSLVASLEKGFNTSEKREKAIGVKLSELMKSMRDSIVVDLNASEPQRTENLRQIGEVTKYRKEQTSMLHKVTQQYTQTFVDDFQNGLLVAVNGVVAKPVSSHASEEEVASSFAGLNAMFDSPEIAGKVLNPFTKTSRDALFFALGSGHGNGDAFGVKNAVQDYQLTGEPVFSGKAVHVAKLDNGNYSVKSYFSGQKDNGAYAHHMFHCIVSNLENAVPTYTVTDIDAIYHTV